MNKGLSHVTKHRRRREQKTNFKKRLKLLKSKKPRLVVRGSSNNMLCQIVEHGTKGDKTLLSVSIKDIRKLGWKGHGGNTSSSYLIGYLCGKEALKKKVKEAVLDTGLQMTAKGNVIFAALKGAVDSGMEIPHSDDNIPSEERITGKHVVSYALKLKEEDPAGYKKRFSSYLKEKVAPETLDQHFEDIKKKIAGTKKT